ncbi:Carbonic anhydrase 6 [Bagarius yarrelli]|uniref:Carbonic anhydrase n=1 Tax=Bagarius yarrelli TaxID=175774 RepID=A0A556V286_BAGYA|nr:Carbonic anhydrase 6 [Bagarius yarrelli]
MLSWLFITLFLVHSQVQGETSSSEEDVSKEHEDEHQKRSSHSNHWGYNDQRSWLSDFADCSGKSQSPIDIVTNNVRYDSRLPAIKLTGYDLSGLPELTLLNNGHTLQLQLPNTMRIVQGFDQVYLAAQLHFHWGTLEVPGSEHTIDNVHFPAELHVVHYNSKYASIKEAANKPDGLAVLGAFIGLAALEDTLKAGHNESLSKNFRTPQNLYGRRVLASFQAENSMPFDTAKIPTNKASESQSDILAIAFGLLFVLTLLLFFLYAYQQQQKHSNKRSLPTNCLRLTMKSGLGLPYEDAASLLLPADGHVTKKT